MSKTKEARRKLKPPSPPVDALTVGWMMTMITTFICLTASIAARAYVRYLNPEALLVGTLSGLLLFSGAVIGLILLVMTPIIVKRKISNPPSGLVFFAYLIGAAPLVGMLLQAWK